MYWPLGSPNIHAASKLSQQKRAVTTDDGIPLTGLDSPIDEATKERTTERSQSIDSSSPAITTDEEDDNEKGATAQDRLLAYPVEKKGSKNSRHTERLSRRDTPDVDDNGEIIAMRVAPARHMFVTLTRTALLVWQTRVG